MDGHIENQYDSSEFEPYVIAIGQLALAWNDLQDFCGYMFSVFSVPFVPGGDFFDESALHIWSSIKSDRSQRDMLKALANHLSDDWRRNFPKLSDELIWIMDRIGELENSRNDAIHSPLMKASGLVGILLRRHRPTTTELIRPNSFSFNPRAISLQKRESILDEFYYCRDRAIVLREYATSIVRSVLSPDHTWPERPKLPGRQSSGG